jgi:hypothetical protein
MAVLTNVDYWTGPTSPATNCGGRWHLAAPGDVLLAHDDPSARRIAAERGCPLVEVTTRPDGSRVVSGSRGSFVLRGSHPPLPELARDPAFDCDVAAFGPPVPGAVDLLDELAATGLRVRVYDRRPWDSPFQVGGVDGHDLLSAVFGADLVLADSEDLRAVAWSLDRPAAPLSTPAQTALALLACDWPEFEAARSRSGLVSRAERLAQVLGVA